MFSDLKQGALRKKGGLWPKRPTVLRVPYYGFYIDNSLKREDCWAHREGIVMFGV